MENTSKIDAYGYVHAGPTCGKSVLLANAITLGLNLIENDPIVFGWLMTPEMQAKLRELPTGKPWHAKGDDRIQWRIIERASGVLVYLLAARANATIVTNNMTVDVPPRTVFKNTISFFREPEAMSRIAQERARAKGKEIKEDYDAIAKNWFSGWEKHRSEYHQTVILKDGEYLCDYFGIEARVVDPKQVERIIYDYMFALLVKFHFTDLVTIKRR